MTIGYIDFEFTREGNGQLRPTELGIAWWQNQYLKCQYSCFAKTDKLRDVRKSVKTILNSLYNNGNINHLVFWDKSKDTKILNDCGINLNLYTLTDLQNELGKTALDKTAKVYDIDSETLKQYLLPSQKDEVKKLSAHTGIGDALRIALIHKHTQTTTTTVTTTTTKTKTTTETLSRQVQLFEYLDTINFDYVLAKKRLSRANTMILWKNAVLDNPHLHIPYDIFVRVLYAHLLSIST